MRKIKTVNKLVAVSIIMFAFSFALVPLYDIICDITGLNGNTSNLKTKENFEDSFSKNNVQEKKIKIQFVASDQNTKEVLFDPDEFEMEIMTGKIHSTFYYARNKTDIDFVGQAIPSVSPNIAAKYLKKIECFCFEKQTLKPGELVKLPVYFKIDKNLPDNIDTITLSYAFFKNTKISEVKEID